MGASAHGKNTEFGLGLVGFEDQGVKGRGLWMFPHRIPLFMILVFLKGHQVLSAPVPATRPSLTRLSFLCRRFFCQPAERFPSGSVFPDWSANLVT